MNHRDFLAANLAARDLAESIADNTHTVKITVGYQESAWNPYASWRDDPLDTYHHDPSNELLTITLTIKLKGPNRAREIARISNLAGFAKYEYSYPNNFTPSELHFFRNLY